MQTSMRISTDNRDALARIAEDELGGISLDEALAILLFEHQTVVALNRLTADPAALADYREEAHRLAEVDVEVHEW